MTETEILALELHRNLQGHRVYPEDIRTLVEELEHRPRLTPGVEKILAEGRRFLERH